MTPYIPGYQPEPIQFWQILYLLSILFSVSICCWGLAMESFRRGCQMRLTAILGVLGIGGIISLFAFPWGFFVHFATLWFFLPPGAAIIATAFSLWCFYLMTRVMFPMTRYEFQKPQQHFHRSVDRLAGPKTPGCLPLLKRVRFGVANVSSRRNVGPGASAGVLGLFLSVFVEFP